MVDIVKQDMTYLWAISGDVVAPDNAKIQEGWGVEVVPRQWWNWMQYRADSNIAYMLQKGIPEWDATTEYLANKSFVTSAGIVYKCLITNTNMTPASNPTRWARAFTDFSNATNALTTLTPVNGSMVVYTGSSSASVFTTTAFGRGFLTRADAAGSRTYIDAQQANTNLTALSGVTAAVNTFPYWTSTTEMSAASITAFGRDILAGATASAVRTTLGLGTAATATVTTSTSDNTIGRVLRVGDFGGFGSQTGIAIPGNDADNIDTTGVYNITGATVNGPVGYGSGSVILNLAWASTGVYHQIAINYASGTQMAFRRRHSTVGWGAWQEVTTSAQLQSALSALGLNSNTAPLLTDLNSVTVTGFSRYQSSAANLPLAGSAGTVQTVFWSTTFATQTVVTLAGTDASIYNRTFTRTYNSGTWGVWKELAATESPTINNASLTGTTTVPTGSVLKSGTVYSDLTGAALYVNNSGTTGNLGITIDNFAPSISFIDRTASAAGSRWKQDSGLLRYEITNDNGSTWSAAVASLSTSGSLGVVGATASSGVGLDVGVLTAGSANLSGTNQTGVRSRFNASPAATSAVTGFSSEGSLGDGTTTATTVTLIDFNANSTTVNTNHTVTGSSCFRANDKASTQINSAISFHGLMNTVSGKTRWNINCFGTAPNYMRGQTVIGTASTLPASNVYLKVFGDAEVSGVLTSDTITATTVNATNFSVSGSFTPTSVSTTGSVSGSSLSASGSVTAGTFVLAQNGSIYSRAVDGSSNSRYWMQDSSGNTTGVLYATPGGTVIIQAGGAQAASFTNTGAASFNSVTASGLAVNTGSAVVTRGGVPVSGAMYANAHFQALSNDATPPAYTFHRVGDYAAALYLTAGNELSLMGSNGVDRQIVNSANLGGHMANFGAGTVGSYALLLVGGGGGNQPDSTVAGANTRFASCSTSGGAPAGTWRLMGFVTNTDLTSSDSITLCLRIA